MNFDPGMSKNEHVKREKDGLDVWDDIHRYAEEGFKSIAKDDFARMRWYGIYQQKPNDGYFMWRVKVPGGRLTPLQLREIGRVTNAYGRGFSDITTRQDIQLHWMTIESFPDALRRVYKRAGMYTHFACGDTPRNVVACPLGGVLKNETVNVGDLSQKVSDMFKGLGKEFSNLPRKFKGAISGCPLHCNQPQINDVSAFGVIRTRNGKPERGMGIMAGGGMSDTPHFAQGLRVFVPEAEIHEKVPQIFKAVATVFREADELRYKRGRARLKFLVADKGWRWTRDEVEKYLGYALEHDEEIVNPRGALHTDHMGVGEQADGLYFVGAAVPRGRWTGNQMLAVAELAEKFAAPDRAQVRLSQKQNVLLVNIPKENVDALRKELDDVGLSTNAPRWRESLISCTGNEFCNLAVVETKQRAKEILEYLEQEVQIDTPIMVSVSGCPNSCAQYQVADIGLTGIPSIYNGKKVDGYNVMVGGCFGENPEFGTEIVKKCPAEIVKKVIGTIVENYKKTRVVDVEGEAEPFRDWVGRNEVDQLKKFAEVPEWTPPPPKEKRAPVTAGA